MGIFLLYDLAGTPFEDFAGTLFLKIWRELIFSLKRRAKCTKGGQSPPPPFLWEKGASANFKIPNLLELYTKSVFFGRYRSVFLGIYHTDTEGKLGQYFRYQIFGGSPSKYWREPPFSCEGGASAPSLHTLPSFWRKKGIPAEFSSEVASCPISPLECAHSYW